MIASVIVVPAAAQAKPPNVLLILLDDIGPEQLAAYGLGDPPYADTHELDQWTRSWVRFEEAWGSPVSSPTRVTIQTGRHGFRTGVGSLVPDDSVWGIDPESEPHVLAKILGNKTGEPHLDIPWRYTTAAFGKWSMGSSPGAEGGPEDCEIPDDECVPNQGGGKSPGFAGGYDDFVVAHQDLQGDLTGRYFHYWISTPSEFEKEMDVEVDGVDAYLTHATFQWFRDWCEANDCKDQSGAAAPWAVYLAPLAAHAPLHCPPNTLYPGLLCNPAGTDKLKYYAMIRSVSIEIDRLLRYLAGIGEEDDPVDPANTLIILAADNGSPPNVSDEPFNPLRSKGTVFEGGVRVPFWIGGEPVAVTGAVEVANGHFVQLLDLFPTILEVAGGDPDELMLDGVSLVRYFTDLDPQPAKDYAFAEWFYPNSDPDPLIPEGAASGQWAVRNATHKLLQRSSGGTAFYRVSEDPFEQINLLLGPLSDEDQEAHDAILDYYETLGFGTLGHLGFCALAPLGEDCTDDDQCCSSVCAESGPLPQLTFTCQLPPEFDRRGPGDP